MQIVRYPNSDLMFGPVPSTLLRTRYWTPDQWAAWLIGDRSDDEKKSSLRNGAPPMKGAGLQFLDDLPITWYGVFSPQHFLGFSEVDWRQRKKQTLTHETWFQEFTSKGSPTDRRKSHKHDASADKTCLFNDRYRERGGRGRSGW
jgi:hypothetical protein